MTSPDAREPTEREVAISMAIDAAEIDIGDGRTRSLGYYGRLGMDAVKHDVTGLWPRLCMAAARAAIAAMPSGWRPIEEAPKDGKPVLYYLDNDHLRSRCAVGWKADNRLGVIGGVMDYDAPKPTHFMFLPSPPEPMP